MEDYQQSEKIDLLSAALVEAQRSMRPPEKDAKNPHLRNNYASLESVRCALLSAYTPSGIALVQLPAVGAPGTASCWTVISHTSGQWIRSRVEVPYEAQKGLNPAQAFGSAYSYARRYALQALTSAAEADDDGESAGPRPAAPAAAPPPRAQEPQEHRAPQALTVEEVRVIGMVDAARSLADLQAAFVDYPRGKRTPAMQQAGERKLAQLEGRA